jgi:hypothetical protein
VAPAIGSPDRELSKRPEKATPVWATSRVLDANIAIRTTQTRASVRECMNASPEMETVLTIGARAPRITQS